MTAPPKGFVLFFGIFTFLVTLNSFNQNVQISPRDLQDLQPVVRLRGHLVLTAPPPLKCHKINYFF